MTGGLSTAQNNLNIWREEAKKPLELCELEIAGIAEQTALAYAAGKLDLEEVQQTATEVTSHSLSERLAFCRAFLTKVPYKSGEQGMPRAENKESCRVICTENAFSKRAIEVFSLLLPPAEPLFFETPNNICEELSAGNADFAILPIEDSEAGKLFRFYEQIDRFELHIANTCSLPYPDGTRKLRHALLYRNLPPNQTLPGIGMLECRIAAERSNEPAELLAAAEKCGLKLRRIDSLPLSYTEDGFSYQLVFYTDGGDAELFCFYLTLFLPGAEPCGRYIHFEEGENT